MMTTMVNQHGLPTWKRSFIGGLAFGGIAGMVIFLMYAFNSFPIPLWGFLSVGAMISDFFFGDENPPTILFSILFWFVAGCVISYFIKSNRNVIKAWVILYAALSLVFFLFFIWLNYILD